MTVVPTSSMFRCGRGGRAGPRRGTIPGWWRRDIIRWSSSAPWCKRSGGRTSVWSFPMGGAIRLRCRPCGGRDGGPRSERAAGERADVNGDVFPRQAGRGMVVWKQRQAGLVGRAVIYHAEAGISYNVSCPLEPLTTICLRLGGSALSCSCQNDPTGLTAVVGESRSVTVMEVMGGCCCGAGEWQPPPDGGRGTDDGVCRVGDDRAGVRVWGRPSDRRAGLHLRSGGLGLPDLPHPLAAGDGESEGGNYYCRYHIGPNCGIAISKHRERRASPDVGESGWECDFA